MSRLPSSTLPDEPPLASRAVLLFTACSYLCVGLSFSYLDRRYGHFGFESLLWLAWTALGFGAALVYLRRPGGAAERHWKVMGGLGLLFALFPGFLMFNLLRWVSLTLLIILSARAVVMRTRRDFYLSLTVIFVVSLMVATYMTADWTVWFYLAPAWLFAALALAWGHAAGVAISRWAKGGLTLGFITLSFVLATLLFLFAPRPPTLGFGFLPPGTDTPNLLKQDAGSQGPDRGAGGADGREGRAGRAGGSPGQAAQGSSGAQPWQQMFERMRRDLDDRHMPAWQRGVLQRLTGWGEILAAALTGELVPGRQRVPGDDYPGSRPLEQAGELTAQVVERVQHLIRIGWPLLLLLLVLLWLLHRDWARRYRLAAALLLQLAGLLQRWRPLLSMRLSALALNCCLRQQGHAPARGQSVREHLAAATSVPELPRRWLAYAVDLYGETRFGGVVAGAQRAANMRQAVYGASQILAGVMPELRRD